MLPPSRPVGCWTGVQNCQWEDGGSGVEKDLLVAQGMGPFQLTRRPPCSRADGFHKGRGMGGHHGVRRWRRWSGMAAGLGRPDGDPPVTAGDVHTAWPGHPHPTPPHNTAGPPPPTPARTLLSSFGGPPATAPGGRLPPPAPSPPSAAGPAGCGWSSWCGPPSHPGR